MNKIEKILVAILILLAAIGISIAHPETEHTLYVEYNNTNKGYDGTQERGYDTTYWNNNSYPIEVMVTSVFCNNAIEEESISAVVYINQHDNYQLAIHEIVPADRCDTDSATFIIGPNSSYRIDFSPGSNSESYIIDWYEYTLKIV